MMSRFINPYNFVSLREKVTPIDVEKESSDSHSGFFTCELENYTPLAIPDDNKHEDKEVKDHFIYPCFKVNNVPVIPGSSLRGSIRSMYETITNSCMVSMDPDEHITKRSDLGTFRPCVLKRENDVWKVYEAKRIAIVCEDEKNDIYQHIEGAYKRYTVTKNKTDNYLIGDDGEKIQFGDEVSYRSKAPGHEKKYKDGGKKEVWDNQHVDNIIKKQGTNCYLFLGESFNQKHAESVFRIINKTHKNYKADDIERAMKGLKDTITVYRSSTNKNLGDRHFGYLDYERAKEKGVIPLWYAEAGGKLYLSMAAIGRVSFQKTMKDLSLKHNPCTCRTSLCPACALFGMVGKREGEKKGKSAGSRVRISDAKLISQYLCDRNVTLKELGAPNPSYLPFYSKDGKKYDENGASIRGRKMYWHCPQAANDDNFYRTGIKTKRNITMEEVIRPKSRFEFKVYYDNLTDEQVSALAWTITLGGNESNLMYKIGKGKPLGLGSCKIKIKEKTERQFSDKDGYVVNETKGYSASEWPNLVNKEVWEEICIISDYKMKDIQISYPYVVLKPEVTRVIEQQKREGKRIKENVLASHKWFKKFKDDKQTLSSIKNEKNGFEALEISEVDTRRDFEYPKCPICKKERLRINIRTGTWYETCRNCFRRGYII